ncbi:hypothetical protein [Streptomyces puniciscabiei]|uniref:hypothetical protein n=1 Tax=Streptomyces puniciscabiei TaxID=164348 RepID=UPI003318DD1D
MRGAVRGLTAPARQPHQAALDSLGHYLALYWLYAPDPSGGDDCAGLHLIMP